MAELTQPDGETLKNLFFIGASFRSAAACERQHLALSGEQIHGLQRAIAQRIPDGEFCMLSTCNRAEFYLAAPTTTNPSAILSSVISRHCPCFDQLLDAGKIQFKHGSAAYEHLLRVSCGLESAVLGDTQIVQQIRQALQQARTAGSTGAYLEHAFGRALSLGARVRCDTAISAGSPGVSAAICDTLIDWQQRTAVAVKHVLLIGAGAINTGVARLLAPTGSVGLTIINRSPDKGQSLAAQFSARTLPWSDLPHAIAQADAVIAATSAAEPVVTSAILQTAAATTRACERKLIVDAGMPPNVEPCSCTAVDVVGIDDISKQQDRQLSRRRAAVSTVEHYIDHELANWQQWIAQRPLEGVLKSLYLDLDELPQRLTQRFSEGTSSSTDELHYIIHHHVKRLLHPHVMELRRMIRARSSTSVPTI